jgi:GNAT superfamily N-acetyltransferase
VVGDPARSHPTWDGAIRPLQGVSDGVGTVIGVPPDAVDDVRQAFGAGVFRTTDRVNPESADLGTWFEQQTDELPEWLAPFNGPRLVAFDEQGHVIAGVGIKVHDQYGQELSVVTEEAARGLGLARRLVATAARRVLAEGAVPTYLHAPDNTASARVADAVGFADQGWRVYGLWPRR